MNLPGTLSHWVWPVLPWRPAPESRRLSGRQGLCVVVMGEGPDSEAPRLCESRPLIGRPSCWSLPLCTPVALPAEEEQNQAMSNKTIMEKTDSVSHQVKISVRWNKADIFSFETHNLMLWSWENSNSMMQHKSHCSVKMWLKNLNKQGHIQATHIWEEIHVKVIFSELLILANDSCYVFIKYSMSDVTLQIPPGQHNSLPCTHTNKYNNMWHKNR